MLGTLYVVGTAIGNPDDVTLRALRILRSVDVIAAEDPRYSRPWLVRHRIVAPVTSYHPLNKDEKTAVLVRRLREGQSVALIVDAGTPGICDPGAHLIGQAQAAGIRVVPVPGVSAVLAALSVCGFAADEFVFCGFLPRRSPARRRRLAALRSEGRPLVLFETAAALTRTLHDILSSLGDRGILVAGELTKTGEFVLRGRIAEVMGNLPPCDRRAEITVVLEGRRSAPAIGGPRRSRGVTPRRASGS